MTRFFWVRHGPTHQKNFTGWRDVPADLSDTAALTRLEAALPQDALVVSSDLIRAVTTADAVQGHRARLPHQHALREFNFGEWDGLHHTEVMAQDPDLALQFWDNPGDLAPPGGESWNTVTQRVNACVDTLQQQHSGRNLVLVAHIGVIVTQVQRAKGCTPYQALGHHIDNLSLTEISAQDGALTVHRINHIC